jgi:hypothetical protein
MLKLLKESEQEKRRNEPDSVNIPFLMLGHYLLKRVPKPGADGIDGHWEHRQTGLKDSKTVLH